MELKDGMLRRAPQPLGCLQLHKPHEQKMLRRMRLRHVLDLGDNRLESRGEKQGQEGKSDECSPERPCRRQGPAVEGAVDIEEIIMSQREEVAHSVEHGMHRHGWKRHSADAKREDAPE